MEEAQVRERADAMCAALVAGDVGKATEDFSKELRQNLGEVVALLPLPATEGTVDSIERGSTRDSWSSCASSARPRKSSSRLAGRSATTGRRSSRSVT